MRVRRGSSDFSLPMTKFDNRDSKPLPTPALVVGYGSIGARHTKILESYGCEVIVVSRRPDVHPRCHSDLREALRSLSIEYAVIASETSKHAGVLRELRAAGYAGRVLVEKPLSGTPGELCGVDGRDVYVGYQLRYDPLVLALRDAIAGCTIISAELRACSYLPHWRPSRDYRFTESARTDAGGGVLRDLSHELDYALWLFGPWRRLTALGGHLSNLEIETDDAFVIIAETERCPLLTVSLNYLDRPEERWVVVNTTETTIRADITGRIMTVGGEVVFRGTPADADETYRTETRAMLSGSLGHGCTFAQGQAVGEMVSAVETAAQEARWVTP